MFPKLSEVLDGRDVDMSADLKQLISAHLGDLMQEFSQYFPDIPDQAATLVKDPLHCPVTNIPDTNDDAQSELLKLVQLIFM